MDLGPRWASHQKALNLLAQRGSLTPFFTNSADVTQDSAQVVKRSQLVLKARSVSQFMETTSHDEG